MKALREGLRAPRRTASGVPSVSAPRLEKGSQLARRESSTIKKARHLALQIARRRLQPGADRSRWLREILSACWLRPTEERRSGPQEMGQATVPFRAFLETEGR